MSIFKRLFSRKSDEPQPVGKSVEDMNLTEVLTHVNSFRDGATVQNLIGVYRRLFDIAMFEHHITLEEREIALKMAEAISADIEQSMTDNPAGLEAFQEATDYHADKAQFYGFGSLQWIIDEHGITAAELIPFIVQTEFAELLPTFLTMMDDSIINDIRIEVLRELIRARRERPDQSDIHVLHALVTEPDRATNILLKTDELRTIRAMPDNHEAAEALVATIMNYGELR